MRRKKQSCKIEAQRHLVGLTLPLGKVVRQVRLLSYNTSPRGRTSWLITQSNVDAEGCVLLSVFDVSRRLFVAEYHRHRHCDSENELCQCI